MSLDGLKFLGIGLACIVTASAAAAITPEERCEADKHKIAGRYAFCRQRVEFKAIKTGASPDFSKCDLKLLKKWSKAEEKAINAGTTCMDGVSDIDIQSFVTAHADAITAALGGGNLPECGDGSVNAVGEQCDGADLGGESCTTIGFDGGALACDGSCGFDTSGCDSVAAPATGETTAFGAGSDGDVQAGADLSYTDNGDGTITDHNTGLMWEKKDDSGGVHDMDNAYTWSTGPPWEMDGTITTVFLAALNSGGGFAGHTDWRIPNQKELLNLLDLGVYSPSADAAFHQPATCYGCTDVTLASCSCTSCSSPTLCNSGPYVYWSSTTQAFIPSNAWSVNFNGGLVHQHSKTGLNYVRAVRGGN